MNFMSRRLSLWAGLALAFLDSNHGAAAALRAARDHDSKRPQQRTGGRRPRPRPDRPTLYCKLRGAVKYAQLSPIVDGVRMRWQVGRLVPRGEAQALPLSKRAMERKRKQAPKAQKPRGPRPNGGYQRGDMKGAMRAARRAGIISPRQQRKYHRAQRAELKAEQQP